MTDSQAIDMPARITAIAPWFGGKRTLAPEIVRALGPHRQYYEPFMGSAAVLLAKPVCQQETAGDLHGDAINLARVLSDELAIELYDQLQRTLFHEDLLAAAIDFCREEFDPDLGLNVVRAYWFFVQSWMQRNGLAGTNKANLDSTAVAVRFTAGGGSPTTRFRSAVESIPAWHRRLQHVCFLRRDAFALLPKFPDTEGLAIYADPPYMRQTRTGYSLASKEGQYVHEFDHGQASSARPLLPREDDHERLAELLRRYRRARVVVSYYDCPRVRELYAGWHVAEHTRAKHLTNQNGVAGRSRDQAPELLLCNHPFPSE